MLRARLFSTPVDIRVDLPATGRGVSADQEAPLGWFYVARVEDIPEGGVYAASIAGHRLALYRDGAGGVQAVDAFCRHLGADLTRGGTVVDGRLKCPFHGWQYGRDGRCERIPYRSGEIPKAARLTVYPVEVRNGSVSVWWHPTGAAPMWRTPELAERPLRYEGRGVYTFDAEIEDLAENIADVAHFNEVHLLPFQRTGLPWLRGIHQVVKDSIWRDGGSEAPWRSEVEMVYGFQWSGKQLGPDLSVISTQHGPGIGHVRWPGPFGTVYLQVTSTQTSPGRVMFSVSLYSARKSYLPAYLARTILRRILVLVEQDIAIWQFRERPERPLVLPEDGYLREFRGWYSQFYNRPIVAKIPGRAS